jgi:hypothetical protein
MTLRTTEIVRPLNPVDDNIIVRAFKAQGFDLYSLGSDEAEEDAWRWFLADWARLNAKPWERVELEPGAPHLAGTANLAIQFCVFVPEANDFDEHWLIAHRCLRPLLTAPDAHWFN